MCKGVVPRDVTVSEKAPPVSHKYLYEGLDLLYYMTLHNTE